MSIALIGIQIKHERRLRLIFSDTLGVGAFGTAPGVLAFFTVDSVDNLGVSPTVLESIMVAGAPSNLELALGNDLVSNGLYLVSAIGVPSAGGPVTDATSQQQIKFSQTAPLNVDNTVDETSIILYGRDLVWNGLDYQETQQGDLAVISGTPNVLGAISRRLLANGLPYDSTYGPNANSYVNGVPQSAGTLQGALAAQCKRDDRIKAVKVELSQQDEKSFFKINPTLIGEDLVEPINIAVP